MCNLEVLVKGVLEGEYESSLIIFVECSYIIQSTVGMDLYGRENSILSESMNSVEFPLFFSHRIRCKWIRKI